jgi:hypothetical protein
VRHHCLAEKKMRDLRIFDASDEPFIQALRLTTIDSLSGVKAQKELISMLKHVLTLPNMTFWSNTPEPQKSYFKSIPVECDRLELKMEEQRTWAVEEFKKVVGV